MTYRHCTSSVCFWKLEILINTEESKVLAKKSSVTLHLNAEDRFVPDENIKCIDSMDMESVVRDI